MARSLWALLVAVLVAFLGNVLIILNGDQLTEVIKYTMALDLAVIFILVPVFQWFSLSEGLNTADFPGVIKNGMKAAAPAAMLLGLSTFLLLKYLGYGLIEARMLEVISTLDANNITGPDRENSIHSAEFIYSPIFHSTFVLLASAITGFLSSIGSALVMRK